MPKFVYEKMPKKNPDDAVKGFLRQPEPDMCETTSMKNVLDELARRHGKPKLKISLSKMNEFYSYRRGLGTDSDVGLERLNDHLRRFGYRIRRAYGRKSTGELLKRIVEDEDCSYPLISVSPEYFKEQNLRYDVPGDTEMEHVLVVMGVNEDIEFFDPYESFLLKSTHVKSVCNILSKPKILRHWEKTAQPRWVVWIEKVTPRLEHFGVSVSEEERA